MRKLLYIILSSLTCVIAVAQSSRVDSLKQLLNTTSSDTVKTRLFSELSSEYAFSEPDSAFYYANEGLQLSKTINYTPGVAWNTFWLAVYFRLTGSSIQGMQLAMTALPIFEGLKDEEGMIMSNNMIGWTALDQQDYRRALEYAFRAARLGEKRHSEMLYYAYGTIAECYERLNKLDSALIFALKAESVLRVKSIYPLAVLARIHSRLNHDSISLQYFHKAILRDTTLLAQSDAFVGIAKVFGKIGQTDSAIYYAKRGLRLAVNRNFLIVVRDAAELLTKSYKVKNQSDSTLKYIQIAIEARDSLFSQEKTRQFQSMVFSEKLHEQELQVEKAQYSTRIRLYILLMLSGFSLLVALILYRNNRSKQKANARLQEQKAKIESTLTDLKSTQNQLIQKEKMASLGELTAGIAHEIQNPLNFVNNFSEVSNELIDEMVEEVKKGNFEAAKTLANDVKQNLDKINHHGKRADGIVKSMLQHSRTSSGQKELTDINVLCDEYLRLSYHGLRAKDKSFNARFETNFDSTLEKINVIPQDIGRVILNLINNAFYAVAEKKKKLAHENYQPTVTVITKKLKARPDDPLGRGKIQISIRDNGNGIPDSVKDKIFQPFFTTKPTGQGTGLGLSLGYDIVKAHGGELKVETPPASPSRSPLRQSKAGRAGREGEGSEFIVYLPLK